MPATSPFPYFVSAHSLHDLANRRSRVCVMNILGTDYTIWDKAAKIRFRKPGRDTLNVHFVLTDDEIEEIRRLAETEKSIDRIYYLELKDSAGIVHAEIEKTIYISKKGQNRELERLG